LKGRVGEWRSGDVAADGGELELWAAEVRAGRREATTLLEVLARALAAALPGSVQVRRATGWWPRRRPVRSLEVALGEWCFRLSAAGGLLRAERQHRVGGVTIRSEVLPVQTWVEAFTRALEAEARRSAAAARALEQLLGR
jgi:hypothetical protein